MSEINTKRLLAHVAASVAALAAAGVITATPALADTSQPEPTHYTLVAATSDTNNTQTIQIPNGYKLVPVDQGEAQIGEVGSDMQPASFSSAATVGGLSVVAIAIVGAVCYMLIKDKKTKKSHAIAFALLGMALGGTVVGGTMKSLANTGVGSAQNMLTTTVNNSTR